MNEKTKKILSALLAVLTVSSTLALASCSGEKKPGDDTSAPSVSSGDDTSAPVTTEPETTQDPATLDELPTDMKDYEGYEFVVLSHDHNAGAIAWKVVDIYTEDETGERINDAVFARNLMMEERFGVKVKDNLQADPMTPARQAAISSDDYTLLQTTVQNQSGLVLQGYLLDMAKFEYINLDKAWWDNSANSSLAIAGRYYYAIGDSQLNAKKATWAVLFNKKLAADANLPDLYAEVDNGTWTIDSLRKYGQAIENDVNGDGQMKWGEDVFGLGLQNEVVLPLMLGTGEKIVKMNPDGTYEYNLGSETNMNALERIWNFINTDNSFILNCNKYNGMTNQWIEFRNLFMADQIGFYMGHLGTVTLVGGDMQSDFGILPFPKVLEDQEGYYSTFQYNNAHAVSALKSTQNTKRTGLLTEAYEMFSHSTVLPAYYDYTLTLRSARDTESGRMLDIIFNHRNLDVSLAFNSQTNMQTLLEGAGTTSSFTFASTEASKRKAFQTNIGKVIDAVLKLGD